MEITGKQKDDLLEISGIQYANGCYSAGQWLEKTGVDPRKYPLFFDVRSNELVVAKKVYFDMIDQYFSQSMAAMNMLTERGFMPC